MHHGGHANGIVASINPSSGEKWKGPGVAGAFLIATGEEPSPALRATSPAGGRGEDHSSGTSSSATMLMILISGFMAGPAVSL
jgi:hypothetical protein